MATIVNLNLGGEGSGDQVYTADLILTSPYTEPSGNLLVLRSAPDIAPITGTLAVVEQRDTVTGDGAYRNPVGAVTGTLVVTGRPDIAIFAGDLAQLVTGTLVVTNSSDTITASGDGYTGLGVRRGMMAVVEQPDVADFDGLWTMKWRATMAVTEQPDVPQGTGDFVPYQGPGFILANSPSDTAQFVGTNVYDVSGTMAVTEVPDVADFAVITGLQIEESSSDTLIASEVLLGDMPFASLVDRFYAQDVLDYDRGMVFADALSATDSLSSALKISPLLADTGLLRDSITAIYGAASADLLVATEQLRGEIPFVVYDELRISDPLSSYSRITGVLADNARAVEELAAIFSAVSLDIVTLTETLDDGLGLQAASIDAVMGTDLLQSTLDVTQIVADTAVATDEVASSVLAESADVVTITEALSSEIGQTAPLLDALISTDTLIGGLTVYAPLLADTATLADVLTSATDLQLAGVLSDTVLAGDSLFEAAQTIYVTNAETGAVSTYVFTPTISGMADYQGVLYLAGPDGLYALDATQDEDGAVVWTIRTGFSNLGTDRLKRIRDINVQARTEGDTTVQVIADRYGKKQEWNYRMPALTRDSYRDGVVKPGQGIQSVYYALGLHGIGPAEIDQLRVVIEPLSRRR